MIPRIIHQTWKTTAIPTEWKNAVEICKRLHPDYTYMLWTDDSMKTFVKETYPEVYPTYASYPHQIQRCDAFRYLVLYKYGGIYLDMDIICKKPLDFLLKYDAVFARSSNVGTCYTNSFFMIIPSHPFMKYCIAQLPSHSSNYACCGKHLHVMNSTGPYFLTNMCEKYTVENSYILSNDEYAGDCNACTTGFCAGGEYFRHIRGQTWNSYDSLFYNFCMCNFKWLIPVFIITLFLLDNFQSRALLVTTILIFAAVIIYASSPYMSYDFSDTSIIIIE